MPKFQFDSIATHSGNSGKGKGKQHFLLRQAAFEVEDGEQKAGLEP